MNFYYCCFDFNEHASLIEKALKKFNAIIFDTNCKRGNNGICRIYTKEQKVASLFQKNNNSIKLSKTNGSDNIIILDTNNDVAGDILAYHLGSITFHPESLF